MTEHGIQVVDGAETEFERRVTVVIPALNEAGQIVAELQAIKAVMDTSGWDYEIVVVDDGSADATGALAAAAGARVLRHRRNRGYGASLKSGIEAARYDNILITDADGTYPATHIPELLALAPECEMVIGARIGQNVAIPLIRRPAKWFLGVLASYLAGQKLPDLNSGLRFFRRSLARQYKSLLPSGFSFTTTITLASACNNHEVGYVPIDYHPRVGQSKIRARHAYDFTLLILRTIVFFNPLKVFIPFGLIPFVAGTAKFAYDVTQNNLSESAVFGWLAALMIWAVGLLADQNARLMNR